MGGLIITLLLVILGVVLLSRMDVFFIVLYFLALVYAFTRVWKYYTQKHLQARRVFVNRAFPGDNVKVSLWIKNNSWLPIPHLEFNESVPAGFRSVPFYRAAFPLRFFEERSMDYTIKAYKRGVFYIGPTVLHTIDLLGIKGRQESLLNIPEQQLIVYPQTLPLQQLGLPTHSPRMVLSAQAPLFEDPTRLRGVRDYQVGDSPRRIHWTASARHGTLLVKQYSPAIAHDTLICLNMDESGYQRHNRLNAIELAIMVAASLATHIVDQETLPVGLAAHAQDAISGQLTYFSLPPHSEQNHLIELMEVLARLNMGRGSDFNALLRDESASLSWGTTLVVITGKLTEELAFTLLERRRSGYAIVLFMVQPAYEDDLSGALPGIAVHHIWRREDLEMALL